MDFTATILQTTDVHCQIHAHDEFFWESEQPVFRKCGGYDLLKTKIDALRQKNPSTLLIDTGDMFQGSQLSVETEGEALVGILNALKYDLYVPGNWEVVYGKDQMIKLLKALNGPVICANMHHDKKGLPGELVFKPYHIWQVNGIKIGILGYTDPLVPMRQSPAYSEGLKFSNPEDTLPHYVEELKGKKKVDFLIIACHLGLSQEIALSNHSSAKGVDYILGGDTHERVRKPLKGKMCPVVEPGAFGSFIGKLDLSVSGKKVFRRRYQLLEVTEKETKPDEKVSTLIANAESSYMKKLNKIIGTSTSPLYRYFVIENSIDTLVTDALKWKFPKVDIAISNGFRFCPPRVTPGENGLIPIPLS
ncbi:MAG TPA: metallophosphoesterase, partial [Bellilinea sp.]|nr:metallophosphoesterase [Bellilinea sp.]